LVALAQKELAMKAKHAFINYYKIPTAERGHPIFFIPPKITPLQPFPLFFIPLFFFQSPLTPYIYYGYIVPLIDKGQ